MKWIEIEDEKPGEKQNVFYYYNTSYVFSGIYESVYCDGLQYTCDCFTGEDGRRCDVVTHWMPRKSGDILPEPPK